MGTGDRVRKSVKTQAEQSLMHEQTIEGTSGWGQGWRVGFAHGVREAIGERMANVGMRERGDVASVARRVTLLPRSVMDDGDE
jgi:hypothetical protein